MLFIKRIFKSITKRKPRENQAPPWASGLQIAEQLAVQISAGLVEARLWKLNAKTGINWHLLVNLPPFQMFMRDVFGKHIGGEGRADRANELELSRLDPHKAIELFDLYDEWHRQAGLWPNETPLGELLGELKEIRTCTQERNA